MTHRSGLPGAALLSVLLLAMLACAGVRERLGLVGAEPEPADTDAAAADTDSDAGDEAKPKEKKGKKERKGKKAGKGKKVKGEKTKVKRPRGGIKYTGNNTWLVRDSKVEAFKENPGRLGIAQIRKDGIYLEEVSPKRDGYHLGLRSGDLLVEANGHSLRGPASAALTWSKVRNDRRMRLTIERAGARQVNRYQVVNYALYPDRKPRPPAPAAP